MDLFDENKAQLKQESRSWLITGCAGFIGSHLLETLLKLDQHVIGLDNFSTGYRHNLDDVKLRVSAKQWDAFKFYEGDIRKIEDCKKASEGVQIILHQAALGSVPRSIDDPVTTNTNNIDGFLNMLVAAKDASVKRFVYAASSSTYGDHPALPKKENVIGRPLSPYAVTKYVNELYAEVFARTYGLDTIGLRYFNVFGPRQDPKGAYAAVIPKWFLALIMNEAVYINGDGETSRDFCFIDNCVQANILAATAENKDAINQVYNVAVGQSTSLNQLFRMIKQCVCAKIPKAVNAKPIYRDFRPGDVRHSLAGLNKIKKLLRYAPKVTVEEGLRQTTQRYFISDKNSVNGCLNS